MGTVSVNATDERELPVPDAQLQLSGPTSSSGTTGLDGRARLEELSPGDYKLTVTKDGFDDTVLELSVEAGGDSDVQLILTKPLDWSHFTFDVTVAKEGQPDQPEDDPAFDAAHFSA